MTDAIDFSSVKILGGAPDVHDYAVTAAITKIEFLPNDFRVDFTKKNGPGRWPDVVPPGWDGPIQWTLWAVVKSGGQWLTTGCIEVWHGKLEHQGNEVGGPFSKAKEDWFYFVPEMHQPQPGEQVGFFVTAGDQRRKDVPSVRERSNIVVVTVPNNDSGVFTFDAQPAPTPEPSPEPPSPSGGLDTVHILQAIEELAGEVRLAVKDVGARLAAIEQKQNRPYSGGLFGYTLTLKPQDTPKPS